MSDTENSIIQARIEQAREDAGVQDSYAVTATVTFHVLAPHEGIARREAADVIESMHGYSFVNLDDYALTAVTREED